LATIKEKDPNPDSKSDYENTDRRKIIDGDPNTIVATTTIQPKTQQILKRGSVFFIHRCG
jgi:hypothetical protein